jgi:hypothetical protein
MPLEASANELFEVVASGKVRINVNQLERERQHLPVTIYLGLPNSFTSSMPI